MNKWLKVSLIAALALALGVGGFFSARAALAQTATATPVAIKGGGLYLRGTLTAATASALTVDTGAGVWTVQLTADTKINAANKTGAAYSDLKLDAAVTVQGDFVSANTLKAAVVSQGRLGDLVRDLANRLNARRGMARGLAIGRGMQGERGIGVMGSLTNTITGTVVSTTTSSITLKTVDTQVTVSVDANTEFKVPGVRIATLDDLKVDMQVVVRPADASATLPATLVCATGAQGLGDLEGFTGDRGMGPGKRGMGPGARLEFPRGGLQGTVSAINGTTLTITTAQGDVTVNTDTNTIFHLSDKSAASLADIAVGDKVIVSGHVSGTTPLDADGVAVMK